MTATNLGVSGVARAAIVAAIAAANAQLDDVGVQRFRECLTGQLLAAPRNLANDLSGYRYTDETVTAVIAGVANRHGVTLP